MMFYKATLLILVVLAVITPVYAQEPVEPRCTKAQIQTMIEMINGGTSALVEEQDMPTVWQVISGLNGPFRRLYTLCNPLVFEGDSQQVIGPVSIPAGLYRAILVTDGYFIAAIEPVDGECAATDIFGLFNISSGNATEGAESLLESDGCEALIVTSNVTAHWTLEFEKIR